MKSKFDQIYRVARVTYAAYKVYKAAKRVHKVYKAVKKVRKVYKAAKKVRRVYKKVKRTKVYRKKVRRYTKASKAKRAVRRSKSKRVSRPRYKTPRKIKPRRNAGCFVAGTEVSIEKGQRSIEQIKAGDKVWAEDLKTGKAQLKKVVEIYVCEVNSLVSLTKNGKICIFMHFI